MNPQDEADERNGSKVSKIINPSQVKLESSNKSTMTTLPGRGVSSSFPTLMRTHGGRRNESPSHGNFLRRVFI